ncbi:MAG: V-type ATPase subunit [Candidatus Hodarchaeales archaeon]
MVGIKDIGYINARFHGLRSHLLDSSQLIQMVEISSLGEFIQILRETPYREFLQRALFLGDELYSIDTAINEYVSSIAHKILGFVGGELKDIFSMLFSRFDVSNLKIALQGLISDIDVDRSLIPFGTLSITQLTDISRASDLKEVYDLLYTYRSPLARALRPFINEKLDLSKVNLSLDGYYYSSVFQALSQRQGKNIEIAQKMFREELEYLKFSFLVTYISLKYKKETQPEIEEQALVSLFDPTTRTLIQNKDINGMISSIKHSRYGYVFDKYNTPKDIAQNTLLASELQKEFILKQVRKAHNDRESIILGLSYFWQLYAEMINLRLISHGIFGSVQKEKIRRSLIV